MWFKNVCRLEESQNLSTRVVECVVKIRFHIKLSIGNMKFIKEKTKGYAKPFRFKFCEITMWVMMRSPNTQNYIIYC